MADDLAEWLPYIAAILAKQDLPSFAEDARASADTLDRLTASLAAKDAEIANLRTDLKVKEIATDEAMAQGERQRAEIEAKEAALADLLAGCIALDREEAILPQQMERAHRVLSQSPADFQARREAEQKVIEAAWTYRHAEQDGTPRMFRGKELHDLGIALSNALEALTALTEKSDG